MRLSLCLGQNGKMCVNGWSHERKGILFVRITEQHLETATIDWFKQLGWHYAKCYLHPLLVQQRIVMTLPDTPHSPLQACRSVGEAS